MEPQWVEKVEHGKENRNQNDTQSKRSSSSHDSGFTLGTRDECAWLVPC